MLSLPVTPGRADHNITTPPEQGPPFLHVELEINTSCDLDCFGCDRLSDVTTSPNMTVKQVALFVDESINANWKWERIRLLGGEPTLHPQLMLVVRELMRYRRFYPKVFLQLLSNGLGKLSECRDWLIDYGIDPHVEAKAKGVTPEWFTNTRIAPVDRDPNVGPLPPCGIFGPRGCGIGLTRHGYFLDGAGASIARVVGMDVGVMSLSDVTWESMLEQAKVLCRLCGHWNPPKGELVNRKVVDTGEVTGKFWTETLANFKAKRPVLRVYGER